MVLWKTSANNTTQCKYILDSDTDHWQSTATKTFGNWDSFGRDKLNERGSDCCVKKLNNNKAHGPNGVPARLLTETASQIVSSLCSPYNKSLRSSVFPEARKLANVVPVHKRSEKSYVENYRPISLLSVSLISKVLQCCVFYNIKQRVFLQIDPCQHGFVPGKLCVTTDRGIWTHRAQIEQGRINGRDFLRYFEGVW